MAADQKNSKLYQYTDGNGDTWSVRGPIDTAINAIDGNAAAAGDPVFGRQTRRRHVRRAIFQDPTTFRTVSFPVFTDAAYAAITSATTLARHVEGETTTVTYELLDKVPEKMPVPHSSRNLGDHA